RKGSALARRRPTTLCTLHQPAHRRWWPSSPCLANGYALSCRTTSARTRQRRIPVSSSALSAGDILPLLQVRITPLARESVCLAQFGLSAPAVEEPVQRWPLEHVLKEPVDDPLLAVPVRTTEKSLHVRRDFADDVVRIGTEILEVLEPAG